MCPSVALKKTMDDGCRRSSSLSMALGWVHTKGGHATTRFLEGFFRRFFQGSFLEGAL